MIPPEYSGLSAVERIPERAGAMPARRWLLPYSGIAATVAILDVALLICASIVTGLIYHSLALEAGAELSRPVMTAIIIGGMFAFFFHDRGYYEPNALMNFSLQVRAIPAIWASAFLIFVSATFVLKVSADFSRGSVLSFGIFGLMLLLGNHVLWRRIVKSGLRKGAFRRRKIILVSTVDAQPEGSPVSDLLACGFEIKHEFKLNSDEASMRQVMQEVVASARSSDIEEIFVAADILQWRAIEPLARHLSVLPIPVAFVPDKSSSPIFLQPRRQFGRTIGIEFQRLPLTLTERFMKRLLDLSCAILGIVLLMPMFVIVAIMIKLDSAGPALFIQRRQGFNSKRFGIFKFRTMAVLDDGEAIKQAQRGDSRITRVGLWLRRTSIDELPQLFNVLIGTMSIVGPRPHAIAHDDYYSDLISRYAFRHKMKPGITGWAQVNGYRGETPNVELMKERVDLDIWYVNNWSLILDIQIILRTVLEVARGRNAY